MSSQQRQRVLRQIDLMEQAGAPMQHQCVCGKAHAITLKDFDLDADPPTPSRMTRFECQANYEYLRSIIEGDSRVSIEIEGSGGPISRALAKILTKLYAIWLNR